MRNKIIIPILMLLCLICIAYADAPVITLDPTGVLINNSYKSSSIITYRVNVTGNASTWDCWLYTNENGSNGIGTWRALATAVSVTNATATTLQTSTGVKDIEGINYAWDVRCNSSSFNAAGGWAANSTVAAQSITDSNFNYSVDTTDPAFSSISPTGTLKGAVAEWFNSADGNTSLRIGATISDYNPDGCYFTLNYNLTANTSAGVTENSYPQFITTPTNGTAFNFSQVNASTGLIANNSGIGWGMICNDSAGNNASISGTFKTDFTNPGAFVFNESEWKTDAGVVITNATTLSGSTMCTDYEPQISWSNSTEVNFDVYRVRFYKGAVGASSSTPIEINLTKQNTTSAGVNWNMTTELEGDSNYTILITAIDDAGNTVDMTKSVYTYRTTSTYHNLSSGWNILVNPGSALSLSAILNYTGATTATSWNGTHQFTSHTSGGSYGTDSIAAGEPFLVYMGAKSKFGDFCRDVTEFTTTETNLTNQTSSDWNLVANRNWTQDFSFQTIDDKLDTGQGGQTNDDLNITFMSYYNNSAPVTAKYVSYVNNWSISNETILPRLKAIWIYVDDTELIRRHPDQSAVNFSAGEVYQTIDWGALS